jgi:hypothetical protein
MPRLYTSTNEPLDFCANCFPSEDEAEDIYGDMGDGPDNRGNCFAYDADHPTYDEGRFYRCECCRKFLTEEEDGYP